MRILSARQCWHDSLLGSRASEGYAPRVQNTVKASSKATTDNAVHQMMAGHVQKAIGTLPPPIQMLGHWLYAPEGVFPAENENALWQMVALLADVTDQDSDEWYMARCALHAYRENAWGRSSELNKARNIGAWLYEQHGVDINSRRFSVVYGPIWSRFKSVLDDLDKRALMPVARVVWVVQEDMSEEDSFTWAGRKVAIKE